jgi:hypothetical protein
LWLPIVVSAVFVFLVSAVLHMVLTYHRADYRALPRESETLADLRRHAIPPGYYVFPHCESPKEMGQPEVQEKFRQGPVGILTVRPSGPPAMGKELGLWFGYCLLTAIFVAYLAGHALADGGESYLEVFRVVGTAAFLGYGLGNVANSIWKGEPWGNSLRATFDGLIYALLTAGVFGWLWPR